MQRPADVLWMVLLCNYAGLLVVCRAFAKPDTWHEPLATLWMGTVYLTYPLLYLLPAVALAWLGERLATRLAGDTRGELFTALAWGTTPLVFASIQLVIYSDRRIHEIYGFHLNGFVWNLVSTPGGLASLGAGRSTWVAAAAVAGSLLLAETALVAAAFRWSGSARLPALRSRRLLAGFALTVAVLSLGERVAYGISHLRGYEPVLARSDAFPFYMPLSFDGLARRLGVRPMEADAFRAELGDVRVRYPLAPIRFRPDTPRSNVVVLCAESLRADALGPELMPATWRLAEDASRYTQHLSSGNGTRMGVFGLLYGLPGPYWFPFLAERRGPVLISALRDRGYEVRGFTSDDFHYPEFDRTVFAEVDRSALREGGDSGRKSWQRDREQVDAIRDYLDARDPVRPFFLYAFFESPHARYDFPPETAVRTPYLSDLDYVTMDPERDIAGIRNRYWNSVRHLDTQLARVFDALAEHDLLDSTILVVTGDHGEEFLEHGRWGHNSAFSEEQIRVPFVLRLPGHRPTVVDRLTSHLDVVPTLFDALGVVNPASDYGLGRSLLAADPPHPYALVSDWSRLAYVDRDAKATFPTRRVTFFQHEVADRRDAPIAEPDAWLRAHAIDFAAVLSELARFMPTASASPHS